MASFRDLIVYKKSFQLAVEVFEMTKTFPKEERSSLIDQVRRSSRSREDMGHILLQRQPMRTWKMQKHRFGWNLAMHADILTRKQKP